MAMQPARQRSTSWVRAGLLIGAYFVAGKLGLLVAFLHVSASPVWPPTGLALAALLIFGIGFWPAIFVGALLVNLTTAGSVATSLGIATGNTLEGVLGAVLVTRFANGHNAFDNARDIFKFAVFAGLLSTTVSATMGVGCLAVGGYLPWGSFGAVWLTWWLGNVAGAMVVAPVLILWATSPRPWMARGRAIEAVLLLASIVFVGALVFNGPFPVLYGLAFLCGPPLVWTAFRFGPRESATAIALLSSVAVWGTLRGLGPFVRESPNESLLLLQAYMVTMAAMAVPLAAVVAERQRAEAALSRVAELVRSSDDAILGETVDGVITHWNPGAERLYGYAAEEAIGQSVSLIVPPELPDELSKVFEQIRRGERVDHYETVRMRKDGRRIEVSVTVSPVRDRAGRIVGASSIGRDITERREVEAARHERDLVRSVASLAAAAAHEINNPLAILVGQLQLLAKEIPVSGRRRIDESLAATRRIYEIVGRLQHVRRIALLTPRSSLDDMLDIRKSSAPAEGEDRTAEREAARPGRSST
jgi:PAS domain S-box-containing protein